MKRIKKRVAEIPPIDRLERLYANDDLCTLEYYHIFINPDTLWVYDSSWVDYTTTFEEDRDRGFYLN